MCCTCLVTKALEEGGLQLWYKGLQAWPCLGYEQAYGVEQGCFHFPCQPVPNDPDHRTCTRQSFVSHKQLRSLFLHSGVQDSWQSDCLSKALFLNLQHPAELVNGSNVVSHVIPIAAR